jgi:hypothetical protein
LAGAVVGNRDARARHVGESVCEVFPASDEHRRTLRQRGADSVRAGALLAVIEAGSQQDGIEPRSKSRVRDPTIDDVTALVREQQACFRTGEVVAELIEDRRRGALETAPFVDVGVVRRVEGLGLEADQGGAAPGLHDLRANRMHDARAGEKPS